eukprot:UN01337
MSNKCLSQYGGGKVTTRQYSFSLLIHHKGHSFAFLKCPTLYGHFGTSEFFREFSSESHRILFLGKLLGVFSIRNSGLMIFKVKSKISMKNKKCFLLKISFSGSA